MSHRTYIYIYIYIFAWFYCKLSVVMNDASGRSKRVIASDIRVSNMSYGPLAATPTTCQRSPIKYVPAICIYLYVRWCVMAKKSVYSCPHPGIDPLLAYHQEEMRLW